MSPFKCFLIVIVSIFLFSCAESDSELDAPSLSFEQKLKIIHPNKLSESEKKEAINIFLSESPINYGFKLVEKSSDIRNMDRKIFNQIIKTHHIYVRQLKGSPQETILVSNAKINSVGKLSTSGYTYKMNSDACICSGFLMYFDPYGSMIDDTCNGDKSELGLMRNGGIISTAFIGSFYAPTATVYFGPGVGGTWLNTSEGYFNSSYTEYDIFVDNNIEGWLEFNY